MKGPLYQHHTELHLKATLLTDFFALINTRSTLKITRHHHNHNHKLTREIYIDVGIDLMSQTFVQNDQNIILLPERRRR